MRNVQKLYQQGDVLVIAIDKIPAKTKPVKMAARGWVLAEGEATGHAHVIAEPELVEMREAEDGTIYVRVKGEAPVDLRHEEHDVQHIAPGEYKIGKVREVDPFSEEIHEVRD